MASLLERSQTTAGCLVCQLALVLAAPFPLVPLGARGVVSLRSWDALSCSSPAFPYTAPCAGRTGSVLFAKPCDLLQSQPVCRAEASCSSTGLALATSCHGLTLLPTWAAPHVIPCLSCGCCCRGSQTAESLCCADVAHGEAWVGRGTSPWRLPSLGVVGLHQDGSSRFGLRFLLDHATS